MKYFHDNLVVVTATIAPNSDVFALHLKNAEERLEQYKRMLQFLLENTKRVTKIIFCDNSNFHFDVSELEVQAKGFNKEIEFLFFKGDEKLVLEHGKGSGEAEIMDFIFRNSQLIKTVDSFYKLTGRVIIENFDSIIKNCRYGKNYFQLHDKVLPPYVETVFYKINCKDFQKFQSMKADVDDKNGIYYEHVIYNNLKRNRIPFDFFPVYPRKNGISGSTGISYCENKFKFFIKNIFSRLRLLKYFY